MSEIIPLQIIPNQALSLRLDGYRYDIALKAAGDVMVADIVRDDVTLLSGQRLMAGTPLLPFAYLADGNFMFATADDMPPWWENFDTQTLVYLTAAEVAAL
jgi:hypothetical protein